jgi:hypothetical protein
MIRKTRHVSSLVKSGGAASKRFSFNSFGIMGACRPEGNGDAGTRRAARAFKGRGIESVEEGGDQGLVRPR